MADLSTCNSPTCAYTVEQALDTCPKCGGPMRAVRESRARGYVLVACGLFLIVLMGGITLYLAPTLMQAGVEMEDGSRFTGTAEQARMILYLFYGVIAFGLLALANGIYQIRTGANHWAFMVLGLLLLVGIIAASVSATSGMS